MESSLDQSLRGRTDISTMVAELLEMILRNLHRVESKTESNMIFPNDAPTPAQQVFLSRWDHACRGIDAALDRLHTIAIAIRKASAKQLDHSVTTILTEEDMAFRKDIASLVRYRFPAARKGLCRQLGDCIAARRRILLQNKQHSRRLAIRRPHQLAPLGNKDKDNHPNPAQPVIQRVKGGKVSHPTNITGFTKASLPDPRAPSLERLHSPPKKALTTLVSNIFTEEQDSFVYPPPPKVNPGETHARCQFCFMALEVKSSEEDNMNRWRRHVDQDVKPYACLFPDCSESLIFFVHRRDWESHMEAAHSKDWLRKVHTMTWFCDFGHDPPVTFETELLWREHMLDIKSHPNRKKLPTQAQLDARSPQQQQIAPREPFVCPLCERVPDELSQKVAKGKGEPIAMHNILVSHVASHIKSLSLMALPSLEVSAQEIRDIDNDSGREHMETASLPPVSWSFWDRESIASLLANDQTMSWDDDFPDYSQPEAPKDSADDDWLEEYASWKSEHDPALHEYPENDLVLSDFRKWQKTDFDVNSQDGASRTELSFAAQFGDVDTTKRLLAMGVDIELADEDGQTPLLWAAYNGHEAIVRLLLENGARIEVADQVYGRTSLSWAASKGHQNVVRILLDSGADVNAADNSQRTPLSWAASRGHVHTVRHLLEAGADNELADSRSGRTPLSWAVLKDQEAVVVLLLDQNVRVDARDKSHRTPLSWAAERGYENIVELLVECGADIEAVESDSQQTPLSLASEGGHERVVRLLLRHGANVEAADSQGWTALSWSIDQGHDGITRLLRRSGARTPDTS
ncbi:hypothetical protein FPOA_03517 [Fusarium poae]|uniref:Uncharacterized protein n=1 Tax=Fusarium poae TaxID=36050 RepID=A0A1B8BA16_FUSPO|nr:hypothetical protein FPOA_03517 [Fusarium poae]